MASIDPTARVASGAVIGADVTIGPYCVIGPNVVIGAGVELKAHVYVEGHTTIGERTKVAPFASLGGPPQSTRYRGGPTRLTIGADCDIRESVTMNRGSEDGGGLTSVGDRGFFMNFAHVAHDCHVGNDVTFANSATLAGHCVVGDYVFIGGLSAAHQFTRIGVSAMVGGMTGLRGDVIPFGLVAGAYGALSGINVVGMRRRKIAAPSIRAVRTAYRALFFAGGAMADRVAAVERDFPDDGYVAQLIAFIRDRRDRPLAVPDGRHEAGGG